MKSIRIVWLLNWFLAGVLVACGKAGEKAPGSSSKSPQSEQSIELAVFAAASLRDVCTELESAFERGHGTRVAFNFGASNALAQQIVAAGKGDVFLSADEAELDVVEQARLVATDTRSSLLSNQLVVVQPQPLPAGVPEITAAGTLADPAIARLSLANPEAVPAGKYAKEWLEKQALWSKLEARVVPGVDVRAALAAVESGAAQAGIVYATDAALSQKVEIALRVAPGDGPKISYPVAALSCSQHPEAARAFVEFLHGARARTTFQRFGFIVVPAEESGER